MPINAIEWLDGGFGMIHQGSAAIADVDIQGGAATVVSRSQIKQRIVSGIIAFRKKTPVILTLVVDLGPKGNGEGRLVRHRQVFTGDVGSFEQGLPAVGEGETGPFTARHEVGGRQVDQVHVISIFQIGRFRSLDDIQWPIGHQICLQTLPLSENTSMRQEAGCKNELDGKETCLIYHYFLIL